MSAWVGAGLLLCGSARADIALVDGGLYSTNTVSPTYTTNGAIITTNYIGTISQNFTVSPGANVLVVELFDNNRDNNDSTPTFMTWSNATLGTTQTLTRAASTNANSYNYFYLNIYYLYNPKPGSGILSCTDTNIYSTNTESFLNGFKMQSWTLSGVDTTVAPLASANGGYPFTQLSISLTNSSPGWWAAMAGENSNSGQGHPLTNSATSGTALYMDDFDLGTVNSFGFVANLASGSNTFNLTEDSTGIPTQMILDVCLFKPAASTEAVVWSENFDDGNADSRWYADAGVWQIGTPTIGPGQAHSPPYCATTGLTANYPELANSRLIRIQTFTVPPAIQFPRLRFWHWFSFASPTGGGADYGVVEVRIGTTGAWQAVSPQYFYSGGDWTYASVDLSAFAGQTIQLAFHLVGQSYNSAPGWYIDDIAFETGTPVLNNPEGWENGIGDWYPDQGIWQVGSPTKSGGAPTDALNGAQAHTGINCAVTLLKANYPAWPNSNSRLISPPFILPPTSYLRFWHWYSLGPATGGGPDSAYVEIRMGTNNWQIISPIYTGNSGAWTEPFVDLTSYGGQTVQLAFHMIAESYSSGVGWYVDDVQIYPYTLSAANPYLNINLDATGTNAIVGWTWLPEYTGFTLQSTTNLLVSPTNWNALVPAPVVVNGQNVVTNPISGTQQYFRLSQ